MPARLLAAAMLLAAAPALADDGRDSPTSGPIVLPPAAPLNLAVAKWVAQDNLIHVKTVTYRPETRTRIVDATVYRVVTKTVQVNGKNVEITERVPATIRKEQSYLVVVPVYHEGLIPLEGCVVRRLSGKRLSQDELAQSLAKQRLVVMLRPGERLDPQYHKVLNADALVLHGEPRPIVEE